MNFLYGNIEVLAKMRLKMNKKGYAGIEMIIVLALFTVGYFVVANIISYNFDVNYEEDLYDLTISSIEKQAALYGENNTEIFAENNDVYMTIEQLAAANAIISTSEGVVADPRDDSKTLNDIRVKITNNDDEITAEVLV